MLFFDVTKATQQSHRSGLVRVSERLRQELRALLADALVEVQWHARRGVFVDAERRRPIHAAATDWLLTPELFSAAERPGCDAWLAQRPCRAAAVYHDSIPLRFPEFTWPQSVQRHPGYLKLLARFDCVFANSAFSAAELEGYWKWLGLRGPRVVPLVLGADREGARRAGIDANRARCRTVVMLGILEPRKNQTALLDAAEQLWRDGQNFSLVLAGRVNPHFGRPIAARVRALRRGGCDVAHVADMDDAALDKLLQQTRFLALPSLAEGCGLPVLESLWAGVPVVCSDLAPLQESAAGGGCVLVPAGDTAALTAAMRGLLDEDAQIERLSAAACARPLPTWSAAARAILAAQK